MSSFNTGQVCRNGHVVTGNIESGFASPFCAECGKETIVKCLSCDLSIRGTWTESFGYDWDAPAHCNQCGSPFPWTVAKLDAVKELANAIEELTTDEREVLAEMMPHLVQETPRTITAGFKVARILRKLTGPGKAALRKILEEMAVEAGKIALGF